MIHSEKFELGDPTLSLLEIWGAEYQESDAMLVADKDVPLVQKIAERERVKVCFKNGSKNSAHSLFRISLKNSAQGDHGL